MWEYGGVGVWEKKEDYLYLRSVASLVWSVAPLMSVLVSHLFPSAIRYQPSVIRTKTPKHYNTKTPNYRTGFSKIMKCCCGRKFLF